MMHRKDKKLEYIVWLSCPAHHGTEIMCVTNLMGFFIIADKII